MGIETFPWIYFVVVVVLIIGYLAIRYFKK